MSTKRVKLCHLLYNFKQQEKSSNNSGSIAVLDLILSFCCCREPEGPPGCSVSRGRGLSSGSRLQMALPSLAPVRRARRLRGGGRVPAGTADDQPGLHSPPATGQASGSVLQRVVEVHQASLSQILQIMWTLTQLWVALLWIRIRNFLGYPRVRVPSLWHIKKTVQIVPYLRVVKVVIDCIQLHYVNP